MIVCGLPRDVAPLSADGSEFTMDVPPGIRVQRSDGGLLDERDMPQAMRSAIRSAGSAAKAAGSAAKAARGFIDSLRDHLRLADLRGQPGCQQLGQVGTGRAG
jgi:hypothetical protein